MSASSIGVVVAGLEALLRLARECPELFRTGAFDGHLVSLTAELAERGRQALAAILPHECAQLSPRQNRRYDAALLFLIYPLGVIDGPMADLILHDVHRYLQGERGVRRYLGDSYFAPDYDRLPLEERTRDYSTDMEARDRLLQRIGDEAQWCIFDPLLSALYGERFVATRACADRGRQVAHFRRALEQVTAGWLCPELYFLKGGRRVANAHAPLQWTQANLRVALEVMRRTAALDPG